MSAQQQGIVLFPTVEISFGNPLGTMKTIPYRELGNRVSYVLREVEAAAVSNSEIAGAYAKGTRTGVAFQVFAATPREPGK